VQDGHQRSEHATVRDHADQLTLVAPRNEVRHPQHTGGKAGARLAARPDEVIEIAVLVGFEQVRVGVAELLERATIQLAEEHLAQVIEQDRRMARQRADRLGGASGSEQPARKKRLDMYVVWVEAV